MNLLASIILTTVTMFSFQSKSNAQVVSSLYDLDFTLNSLEGEEIVFSKFKGKKVLFVNVASKCGFTPQYKDLQELHSQYKDKLVIIGVPCNQFGKQEPGSSDEIATFCQKNYGVEFLMTEKIDVKGDGQHDLYKWLTDKSANGKVDASVKWNFQKYLIDENGKMVDYFMSSTKPLSSKITSLL
jgi:glutathione peroxidase